MPLLQDVDCLVHCAKTNESRKLADEEKRGGGGGEGGGEEERVQEFIRGTVGSIFWRGRTKSDLDGDDRREEEGKERGGVGEVCAGGY